MSRSYVIMKDAKPQGTRGGLGRQSLSLRVLPARIFAEAIVSEKRGAFFLCVECG
jgi:hypothetical protein